VTAGEKTVRRLRKGVVMMVLKIAALPLLLPLLLLLV
jgi:hypothetical protein